MNIAWLFMALAVLLALVLGVLARGGRQMVLDQWTVAGRGFGAVFVFLLLAGEKRPGPHRLLQGVVGDQDLALGWQEAADSIVRSLERTIASKVVTYDFARLMTGATEVRCSAFADAVIGNLA